MNFEFFSEKQKAEPNIELSKQGDVEVVDIKPEEVKTETPVTVAPGWGNTPENLKEFLISLAQRNRRVLSVSHSRQEHGIKGVIEPKNDSHDLEEIHKALTIISTLREKGIDRTDAIGYSEGGINLLIAAQYDPERFRNIVLANPAGMIGKDNIFDLAKRFIAEMNSGTKDLLVKPEIRKPIAIFLKEISNYIAKNPLKTYREVKAISEGDIRGLLKELREKGVGISIIHGVDDRVFPMDKVQQNITTEHADGFYSIKGGHAEIFLHPEKITTVADEALDALEKRTNNN